MASGWYGQRSVDLIRARSLFVKVMPPPASLSERRAVLHALQQHGRVELFKRLTQPDTFVCAPTNTEAANELLKHSPFTFKYISEPLESIQAKARPGAWPINVAAPIKIHESKDSDDEEPAPPRRPQSTHRDLIQTFKLYIHPSQRYYEHKRAIRRNVLHGPWPKTALEDQDSVFFALQNVIPNNIAHNALCDWHTGGQLSEVAKAMRSSEEDAVFWHARERHIKRQSNALARNREQQDELVAWTSVDPETRLQNERISKLQALNKPGYPGKAPSAAAFSPALRSHAASATQSDEDSELRKKQQAREAFMERAITRGDGDVPILYPHLKPKKLPTEPGWDVQLARAERRKRWFANNQFRQDLESSYPLEKGDRTEASSLEPSSGQQSYKTKSVPANVGRISASESPGLQTTAADEINKQSSQVNASLADSVQSVSPQPGENTSNSDDAASGNSSKANAMVDLPAPEAQMSSPPKSDSR